MPYLIVLLLTSIFYSLQDDADDNQEEYVEDKDVSYHNIDVLSNKRWWCRNSPQCYLLAEVGYFEARGESDIGVVGVMQVVMNRVEAGGEFRGTNTVESVVYKKWQFSYLWDKRINKVMRDKKQLDRMLVLAYDVLHNEIGDVVEGATHYHTVDVKPSWRHNLQYVSTIDRHIFYK